MSLHFFCIAKSSNQRVNEVKKSIIWLLKMTAEMTASYIMVIWIVEMTAEMTAG